LTDDFDVRSLVRRLRSIMHTDEILAAGGGFPALRRAGDLPAARAAIPDDVIRHLAIIGPPEAVRARLGRLEDVGVTHVGVAPPRDATSEANWRALLDELRGYSLNADGHSVAT
jgi:alkanesulfonate monooxygenase SsuD/methylene tetrahydromethanopterin reductase-like flavin-dependent oxidoreductase (luciferase family)